MAIVTAEKTVVKSVPELWQELEDGELVSSWLNEALGEDPGPAQLVDSEPGRRAQWHYAGRTLRQAKTEIELERKGWGTRVTLTGELKLKGFFSGSRERKAGERMQSALDRTLEELGTDSKRPFSRN